MGKSVRRRHNKDGSVTKTTTYSRKNIFGTRVVDTYTTRSKPKSKEPQEEKKQMSPTGKSIIMIIGGIIFFLSFLTNGLIVGAIIAALVAIIGVYSLPIDWQNLFTKKDFSSSAPQAVKTENGWICPECKTENSNSVTNCKGCGRYK